MVNMKKILFMIVFSGFVFLFMVTNFNITINKQGVNITKTCIDDADAQTCVPIPTVATNGRIVGGFDNYAAMQNFCRNPWGTGVCSGNRGACTGGTVVVPGTDGNSHIGLCRTP